MGGHARALVLRLPDPRDVTTPRDVENGLRTRLMFTESLPIHDCDVLVIGAGAAGLTAALEAHGRVTVVASSSIAGSASHHAQGGIAAALDEDDTPALHADDTIAAGRGLSRRSAVDVLVREGASWVERLAELGVPFGGEASLEGGHHRRRVHQVRGAETGRALVAVLAAAAIDRPGIDLSTGERVVALWVSDGRCVGARTDRRLILARATIMATGGYAALWRWTTNPAGSLGEGLQLAYAAGAALADLEFVQFHPTALATSGQLLSEALRGEGATLLDERGERFVDELAPRDVVARAVHARGGARLDLRPVDLDRFPAIAAALRREGFDPAREPVPVRPAAHYTMGGVVTDLDGRSTVPGLYAAGETACTGVHGANRLASNSLLECVVFGARAARAASEEPAPARPAAPPPDCAIDPLDDSVRETLDRGAGVVRDGRGLEQVARLEHRLASLIGRSALARAESRGAHWRSDAPCESAALAGHFVVRAGQAPALEVWA